MGITPTLLIRKYFSGEFDAAAEVAESELKFVLKEGFPLLSMEGWRATADDSDRLALGQFVPDFGGKISLSYLGSRNTAFGRHLAVRIYVEDEEILGLKSTDIGFVQRISTAAMRLSGFIVSGQTKADMRSFGVTMGKLSEVFAFELAQRSRLDGPPAVEPSLAFPREDFIALVTSSLPNDNWIDVATTRVPGFLRSVFRDLAGSVSRQSFDEQFGRYGVFWRPRRPLTVIRSLI